MDLLVDLVFIGAVFYAGWTLRGLLMIKAMTDDPDRIIDVLRQIKKAEQSSPEDQPSPVKGTELRIERHQNTLYAFTADQDEFIAQGSDLNELLERAHRRFPGRVFFGEMPEDRPAKELA